MRKTPKILELGVGDVSARTKPEGTYWHDWVGREDGVIDYSFNLDQPHWPIPRHEWSFNQVHAFDVMEHLSLPIGDWLVNVWRLLVPGGLFIFRVPEWNSWHAFADPTHMRPFHEITFDYFDPDKDWFRRYGQFYGTRSRGKWWKVEQVSRKESPTLYGPLRDLTFVLRKRPFKEDEDIS